VTPATVAKGNVYREFVALEREAQSSPEPAAFWRSRVSEELHKPGRPRLKTEVRQNLQGQTSTLNEQTVAALTRLARRCEVPVKAVLLSALCDTLAAHWGGRPTVGVVTSGRSARLSDPLGAFGLFWKLLPFHVQTPSDTVTQKVAGVQAELLAIEQHVLYPLDAIGDAFGGGELFYATFNYVSVDDGLQKQLGANLQLVSYETHDKFHYPINYRFTADAARGVVDIKVEYDNAYFDDSEIEQLNATFQRTISGYLH
jgi:hypothetical protein